MVAKRKSTALTVWEKELAEAAQTQVALEKVEGNFRNIGTRGGILTVDDAPVKGNALRVVVLVTAFENAYYEGTFDPSNLAAPACFSLSTTGEAMSPHENSSAPQHDVCTGCPHNEFGSAETGRGKACKNTRRLMLVTADSLDSVAKFEEAEVRMLKLPPTSGRLWSKYVHRIAEEVNRPVFGVVTLISAVTDAKTNFKITFEFEGLVKFDQKLMGTVKAKITDLSKEVVLPYPVQDEASAKKAPAKKAPAKKAPAKAKY
jgi:hypothetical protein